MNKAVEHDLINLINASLWGLVSEPVGEEVFDEMCKHAISSLPWPILSKVATDVELYNKWKKKIIHIIAYNVRCEYIQSNLPLKVPYTVLKGTTAAQYYTCKECRELGDIDIMTRREDFDLAYNQFLEAGFKICKATAREIGFIKDGVIVELHRYFGSFNKPEQAQYMDDLIISNINEQHILPDLINGVVLLEHFSQHLEEGIGLRQTIDWMMYVHSYLNDDNWPKFCEIIHQIDLEKLAIILTRMCEIYFRLPQHEWSSSADVSLCKSLFTYVLECGNFGNKRTSDDDIIINALTFMRTPKSTFLLLQNRGLENWKLAKKYSSLRTFAWLYQAFRYIYKGIYRSNSPVKIKKEYALAKDRNRLIDALGIKRNSRGLVVYKNGKYTIT